VLVKVEGVEERSVGEREGHEVLTRWRGWVGFGVGWGIRRR
jgi:hypothetical protein